MAHMTQIGPTFDTVSTIAGVLPDMDTLHALINHPEVIRIAEDSLVHAASYGETIPYGILMSQYSNQVIASSELPGSPGVSGTCQDGTSLKVAVVDSGVDVRHPDLPCYVDGSTGANCVGIDFTNSGATSWANPTFFHGT